MCVCVRNISLCAQAVTTLALCAKLANAAGRVMSTAAAAADGVSPPISADARVDSYLSALRKYATFVLEGSSVAPENKKGTVRLLPSFSLLLLTYRLPPSRRRRRG